MAVLMVFVSALFLCWDLMSSMYTTAGVKVTEVRTEEIVIENMAGRVTVVRVPPETIGLIKAGETYGITYTTSNWRGSRLESIEQADIGWPEDETKIVAYVEGEPVRRGEIEKRQQIIEFSNLVTSEKQPDSRYDALEHLVVEKVLASRAKEEGLWPTDEEVKSHIHMVRESFKSMGGEAQEQLTSYLDGLGLTEDEYFEDYAFEEYRTSLAMGRYTSEHLITNFAHEEPHIQSELMDRELEKIRQEAEVQVIDSSWVEEG